MLWRNCPLLCQCSVTLDIAHRPELSLLHELLDLLVGEAVICSFLRQSVCPFVSTIMRGKSDEAEAHFILHTRNRRK